MLFGIEILTLLGSSLICSIIVGLLAYNATWRGSDPGALGALSMIMGMLSVIGNLVLFVFAIASEGPLITPAIFVSGPITWFLTLVGMCLMPLAVMKGFEGFDKLKGWYNKRQEAKRAWLVKREELDRLALQAKTDEEMAMVGKKLEVLRSTAPWGMKVG